MNKKLCLKYNIPSLYRSAIYRMIDDEYDCDWYFGPTTAGIKEMDTSCLKNVKRYKVIGNVNLLFPITLRLVRRVNIYRLYHVV